MKTRLIVGHKANLGLVRDTMEDAYFIKASALDAEVRRKGSLLVVADGVGGNQAGEVASNMAANGIISGYYANDDPDRVQALQEAILDTNTKIFQRAQETNFKQMSTTVVCALVFEGTLILAHAGDSRAYLYRGGELLQLTVDHSLVNEQVQQGLLKPEDAASSPVRNVITQSLGNRQSVTPEIKTFGTLHNQDRLMLCTDGLYDLVTTGEMKIVLEKLAPQPACEALVERANQTGGTDNVTVIVAEFRSDNLPEKVEAAGAAAEIQPETPDKTEIEIARYAPPAPKGDDFSVLKMDMVKSNLPEEVLVRQSKLDFSYFCQESPLPYHKKQSIQVSTGEIITCGLTIREENYRGAYPIKLEVWAEGGGKTYNHKLIGYGAIEGTDEIKSWANSRTSVVFDGNEMIPLAIEDPLIFVKITKCQFAPRESASYSHYAFAAIEFSFLILSRLK